MCGRGLLYSSPPSLLLLRFLRLHRKGDYFVYYVFFSSVHHENQKKIGCFSLIDNWDFGRWNMDNYYSFPGKLQNTKNCRLFHHSTNMSNMIIYLLIPFIYSCVIRGMQNESPAVISFQETFKEGSNLTIVSNKTKIFLRD